MCIECVRNMHTLCFRSFHGWRVKEALMLLLSQHFELPNVDETRSHTQTQTHS